MRVRLIFDLLNKGTELPYHHQYLISELLTPYINSYLKSIKEPSKVCYNFSSLKGQTKIGKEGLHYFSAKVSLVFSSNDPVLVETLVNQLYNEKNLRLGKLFLNPSNVDKENPIIFKNEMKYICLSPMAIINPLDTSIDAKLFINPSFDAFSDALYENTLNRMERAGATPEEIAEYFQFQLIPDKEYLTKMKGEEKKFARIFPVYMNEEKYEIRGYTFPFTFYAHPKVQEFIFTCGFGVFTERGFGMLDLANTDPNLRVVPFPIKRD